MTKEKAASVVKRSFSMSAMVAQWADELALAKGFGTNFSAYIADLIRRDREREDDLRLQRARESFNAGAAGDQIVEVVKEGARKKRVPADRKRP